jgi:predicted RNA polymerase sigma factor
MSDESFTSCQPALTLEGQVALTLRVLPGPTPRSA